MRPPSSSRSIGLFKMSAAVKPISKIMTVKATLMCAVVFLFLSGFALSAVASDVSETRPRLAAAVDENAGNWVGVDESVVEKIAEEHGRSARDPLINTDQGDILLFVFLMAGAIGGFAAGYYWRTLTERGVSGDLKSAITKNTA